VTTNTDTYRDVAFAGSEYIDPREGTQVDPTIRERLTDNRMDARRSIAAMAREHYALLAEADQTYRAWGAAGDSVGDFVAAWIAWDESGNDGPPPRHHDVMSRLVEQRTTDPTISRYVTPDGVPRTRFAPIGREGIRQTGPGGVIAILAGDHGRYAPVNRREQRFSDAVHRKATRLWDGTLKTQAKADAEARRLADDIDRGLDKVADHPDPYNSPRPTTY